MYNDSCIRYQVPLNLWRMENILSNISRSKGNQTMKFGQLIKCNMRNIFFEKSYIKCGGEASSRPFYKTLSISLDVALMLCLLKQCTIFANLYPRLEFVQYVLVVSTFQCLNSSNNR